jgi:hypothetical protein
MIMPDGAYAGQGEAVERQRSTESQGGAPRIGPPMWFVTAVASPPRNHGCPRSSLWTSLAGRWKRRDAEDAEIRRVRFSALSAPRRFNLMNLPKEPDDERYPGSLIRSNSAPPIQWTHPPSGLREGRDTQNCTTHVVRHRRGIPAAQSMDVPALPGPTRIAPDGHRSPDAGNAETPRTRRFAAYVSPRSARLGVSIS